MEPALKQRLLGAAVLVALAVVFLPLLVMDPAPDSGASRVPLRVPAAPETGGETRTLDLPLATPGAAVLPTPAAAPATPATSSATDAAVATPATAAGDYAVNFGSYATTADAGRVIAALAAAKLPAYQEAATLGTRTVHRVRIGPYATAAAAEAARLAAGRVRSDVNARVVVLDAAAASAPAAVATTAPVTAAPAITTAPLPAAPATQVSTAPRGAASAATPTTSTSSVTAGTDRTGATASAPPQPATPPVPPAPRAPAAASVGFAVQLGAFANPEEAARLRDRARGAGFAAFVEQVRTDHGTLNRVRVGPAPDRAAADVLRSQVAAKLGVSGIVRPHP